MGFDISGIGPENQKGTYFRNNCWWWRRLADFVLEHVEMPKKERMYWHSNDGQRVSKKTSLKIAEFLNQSLKERDKYKEWIENSEKEYALSSQMTSLRMRGNKARKDKDFGECHHPFSWQNVKGFARFCENSGGFEIW